MAPIVSLLGHVVALGVQPVEEAEDDRRDLLD